MFRTMADTGQGTYLLPLGTVLRNFAPFFTDMPGCWTVLMLYEPVRVYTHFINASVHRLSGDMIKNGKLFVSGERIWNSGVRRRKVVQLYTVIFGTVQFKYFILIIIYVYVHVCMCMCICV